MSKARLDKTTGYVGSGAKTFLANMGVPRFVAAAMVVVSHLDRRKDWFEGELDLDLDPARLVFIEETVASMKMASLHGRHPAWDVCRPPRCKENLRSGLPRRQGRPCVWPRLQPIHAAAPRWEGEGLVHITRACSRHSPCACFS